MNQRSTVRTVILSAVVVCGGIAYWLVCNRMPDFSNAIPEATPPRITPDYSALVIPSNCAPLNFVIDEPGTGYSIRIRGSYGREININTQRPAVQISLHPWRELLSANSGGTISIEIYVHSASGMWKKYPSIIDTVSKDPIDQFLVYRLLPPLYTTYGKMGIYQRTISTFEEKPLWLNRMSENNCMNCHTFKHNDPDYFVAHMRGGQGNGTIIKQGKNIFKVNTATDFNKPAGYPAWHPTGNSIAFSVNTIRQFFHATGGNREGCDMGSKIILYDIQSNTIFSPAVLSNPAEMPTQPEWSPDGNFLYYCTAPAIPADSSASCFADISYDLLRIPVDPYKDTWGQPEMVLSHESTGGGISFPRISPDGKFMLFCMSAHGTFPVFRPGGDICMMNLTSLQYRKLDVNSNEPESFPRWSSNGRWFVFASKRMDGICARLYFCHVDSSGSSSKQFLLPQKNPRFYQSVLRTYNLPELISKPFTISPRKLVHAFQNNAHQRRAKLSDALRKRLSIAQLPTTADSITAVPWENQPSAKSATH
jgi:hypothetical protein